MLHDATRQPWWSHAHEADATPDRSTLTGTSFANCRVGCMGPSNRVNTRVVNATKEHNDVRSVVDLA